MKPVQYVNGQSEWTHQSGDKYHVTGTRPDGRRFKRITDNPHMALGINVYRGTLWLVRDGKRYTIRRYWN